MKYVKPTKQYSNSLNSKNKFFRKNPTDHTVLQQGTGTIVVATVNRLLFCMN